jgi:hypothetical protein
MRRFSVGGKPAHDLVPRPATTVSITSPMGIRNYLIEGVSAPAKPRSAKNYDGATDGLTSERKMSGAEGKRNGKSLRDCIKRKKTFRKTAS